MLHPLLRSLIAVLTCIVCVTPSWVWARGFDRRPQVVGIVAFGLLYAIVAGSNWYEELWESRPFRKAVIIGYGVRIVMSAAFPVGMAVDLLPGLISAQVAGLTEQDNRAAPIFMATVVQGLLLHAILWTFIGIVYAIASAIERRRDRRVGRAFEVILPSASSPSR